MTESEIIKGLLGKTLTETIDGREIIMSTVTEAEFIVYGAVKITLKDTPIPVILSCDRAIMLISKGRIEYTSGMKKEVVISIEGPKRKTKRAKK